MSFVLPVTKVTGGFYIVGKRYTIRLDEDTYKKLFKYHSDLKLDQTEKWFMNDTVHFLLLENKGLKAEIETIKKSVRVSKKHKK